ncbi:Gibberellin-regulated protein 6 [Dendrobium catenatum]|uniref:Gibberellin-regulated protein 6 n=1 Tax=Dendrobium catenatum TaxID=906689 RepID=A0A2I0VBI7_9ASPA|nr:Gibberellin-regulated protein 6 [Dendrobium catenatum]
MIRSASSFFFIVLLFSCTVMAASEYIINGELGMSLAAKKQKHKHSGFSAAECPGACQYRCSKTSYKKPCLFFCQKCCLKCRCVPPGTFAHKEVCPCYNNWKTKRGGPKCP